MSDEEPEYLLQGRRVTWTEMRNHLERQVDSLEGLVATKREARDEALRQEGRAQERTALKAWLLDQAEAQSRAARSAEQMGTTDQEVRATLKSGWFLEVLGALERGEYRRESA